ncbi:MAG: undecaprenyldiphospho-muramoylpentapeptide beta-N-acetylglucosaminyltransferase [Clostridia bacterium]|nr:undecaprenyldiphospho-muramoylpentapeptide beta-N-acetylglucosaminyltransferase [Clostridia bacterium]
MRLLLCGGGTAGHVNPAIAIAEEALRQDKTTKILFVGREGGKENNLIKKAGFEIKTIKIQGLKRSLSPSNLGRVLSAIKAKKEAEKIIKDFMPDVIVGTGGYVCWPVVSAAKTMKVPRAIHESNFTPGLTTKLLSGKCDRVFLGVEDTKHYLSKKAKTLTVGNPTRETFKKVSRHEARRSFGIADKELFILSFGGSIGSEKLNSVVLEVMEKHSAKKDEVKHLHATGERYFSEIKSEYKAGLKNGCAIVPYIDNMPVAMKAADIVICRSGAMTVSEIVEAGVASILIPSPNVSGNHQYHNAKRISDLGAAILIEEKDLDTEGLTNKLILLENDKNGRKNRAKKLKELFIENSAKLIVEELKNMINQQK